MITDTTQNSVVPTVLDPFLNTEDACGYSLCEGDPA